MSEGPRAVVPVSNRRTKGAGFWADSFRAIRRDRTTLVALAVFLALTLVALGADLLSSGFFRWGFTQQNMLERSFARPTLQDPAFWLGGDQLGRSEIVRLMYGARISLFIGTFGALVAIAAGATFGIAAGYLGGRSDDLFIWFVSTITGIPTLFLLLVVGLLFRPDPIGLAIFLGFLTWPGIANLARGQTYSLREREYVIASRATGATATRVMLRHIFPNILPLLVVAAMIDVGTIILAESALSYLGFGVQPPVPSWGNMLTGAQATASRAPWLVYGPGAVITLTVLCMYLIGDGLRDALDPRRV
jgi:peptide/nickel transport system permease protein